MIMVAAISSVLSETKGSASRPPLLPSERENGVHQHQHQQQRRVRAREVPSRYMSMSSPSSSNSFSSTTTNTISSISTSSSSSSSSRRFPSPLVSSRNSVSNRGGGVSRSESTTPRRSQSVDRKRSVTPKKPVPVVNAGEMSSATKLLVTSTRSLSVSFQGETFSLPVSKTKAVNQGGGGGGGVRKATPERRRSTPLRGKVDGGGGDEVERLNSGSKPGDQLRWPARSRQFNMFSRNFECSNNESKDEYLGSSVVARALRDSLLDESRRASFDGILNIDSRNGDVLNGVRGPIDVNSVNESSVPSDLTASDSDSVSSGSSGAREMNGGSHVRSGPRGIVDSARFWQETNMRLRRLQDPGLGLSSSPSKFLATPKLSQSRKFSDGPMSSPRTMSSPIRGAVRSASPSKLISPSASSPMRGLSPSRVRNSIGGPMCGSPWDAPSVLSFAVDVRRGKVGENRIVDAHHLRLLYNRHLQWRFVNARADTALSMQRRNAEKNLWNAWITITALRDSVRLKRTQVQLLRQKMKLTSILRGQITYLEEWALLDEEHSCAMHGAIESLKASTLRLPVVGGATADVQSVKEAVRSAVDVIQSMTSSTCSVLAKVEEVNSLMTELSRVAAKERNSLQKCKEVLSMLSAVQVKDCSLRTHILQLNRSPLA
ncbi:QWRF motif-containing protein 2 [Silene latifolia]|uniref:QWRF motif-containing protein 2 n=1 Tax=Silene latifolia TaxID=37657 RepID=UPI003D76EC47